MDTIGSDYESLEICLSSAAIKYHPWIKTFSTLERLNANGYEPAGTIVLAFCSEYGLPIPEWASDACLRFSVRSFGSLQKKGRGRHAKWIRKIRDDLIDCIRWDAIDDARDHQMHLMKEFEALRNLKGDKARALRDRLAKQIDQIGTTLDQAFHFVSECIFEGTEHPASTETLRRSYRKVLKEKNNPLSTHYYGEIPPSLMSAWGLHGIANPKGNQIAPLFDLT